MVNSLLNICCSTDNNYIQHCAVMLCSLFENNKNNNFNIHILINDLSEENKLILEELALRYNAKVLFYKVDSSKLIGCKYRKWRPLTEAAYFRILLSSIIPLDISKILYLDCDIVVNGEISDLFNLEINNYPLAAVKDPYYVNEAHLNQLSLPYGSDYFNSGVMLINLDYWRINKSEKKLLEYAKRERVVYCHDQDALNYVFKNNWYRLHPKWNRPNTLSPNEIEFLDKKDKSEFKNNYKIIHYIDTPKPWENIRFTPFIKLYKKYLNKTKIKFNATKTNNIFIKYLKVIKINIKLAYHSLF